jgi:hypothetical protein
VLNKVKSRKAVDRCLRVFGFSFCSHPLERSINTGYGIRNTKRGRGAGVSYELLLLAHLIYVFSAAA